MLLSVNAGTPELSLRPGPAAWRAALASRTPTATQTTMRRELGLSTTRPVVMSGHQCELWHAGILAKRFCIDQFAPDAEAAWVEVDQDSGTPWEIRYPGTGPTRELWTLPPPGGTPPPDDTPSGALAPIVAPATVDLSPAPAIDAARAGVQAIAASLRAHADAATLALQLSRATDDLLAWAGPGPVRVFATALHRTTFFGELVGEMSRDARGCVTRLNEAAAIYPKARVRPLVIEGDRIELPLWRVRPGQPRRAVFANELTAIPREQLAPKAIAMTALLRAGACDLFVHGLGGERYDRITEAWMHTWLGWRLAPTVVATATVTLPFVATDVPDPAHIARARWEAWHARNDPAMLGDDDSAARKRALASLASGNADRAQKRAHFREMRGVVEDSRSRAGAALAALSERAQHLAAQRSRADVVFDRTWAFPLHPRASLESLRDAVHRAFHPA